MAKRPLNKCGSCGVTWYPRGTDKSVECPKCGAADITTEAEARDEKRGRCCCLVIVGVVAIALVSKIAGPPPGRQPSEAGATSDRGTGDRGTGDVAQVSSTGDVEQVGSDTDVVSAVPDLRHAPEAGHAGTFRARFVRLAGEPSFGRGMLVALDSVEQPDEQTALVIWMPETLLRRLEADGTLAQLIQKKPNVVVVLIPGLGDQPPGMSRLEVER